MASTNFASAEQVAVVEDAAVLLLLRRWVLRLGLIIRKS
jgi:hypothetical protein